MTVKNLLNIPLEKVYEKEAVIQTFKCEFNAVEYYLYKNLDDRQIQTKGKYNSYICRRGLHNQKLFLEKL